MDQVLVQIRGSEDNEGISIQLQWFPNGRIQRLACRCVYNGELKLTIDEDYVVGGTEPSKFIRKWMKTGNRK